jgi:uncharacterized protein
MSDGLSAAWPGGAMRFLALRLLPGADLRGALQAAYAAEPEPGGFVAACAGSLEAAQLRFAGREGGTELAGPLEIVALSGSFSQDGPHLHLTVADADGRVTGGHLLEGAPVRTTAEVVIGLVSGVAFRREADRRTGHSELFFGRA